MIIYCLQKGLQAYLYYFKTSFSHVHYIYIVSIYMF